MYIYDTVFMLERKSDDSLSDEVNDFERLLKNTRLGEEYRHIKSTLEEMDECVEYIKSTTKRDDCTKDIVPVGSLEFVTKFLSAYFGVCNINPIEIPKSMRTKENTKRMYKIVPRDGISKDEFMFIKDATKLKNWSTLGFTPDIDAVKRLSRCNVTTKERLAKISSDAFVISECVKFSSEYRVFVVDGVVEYIALYTGDPLVLPDADFIAKVVNEYYSIERPAKAITIDIGIIPERGTALIEIHPFVSCGTYGYKDSILALMYKLGFEYVRDVNTEIEKD